MTDYLPIPAPRPGQAPTAPASAAELRQARAHDAALRLEASFLSEMLKAAGFGAQAAEFSGGMGEEQFASFHRDAIARQMAEAGGIGLAEHFFDAIMEVRDDR